MSGVPSGSRLMAAGVGATAGLGAAAAWPAARTDAVANTAVTAIAAATMKQTCFLTLVPFRPSSTLNRALLRVLERRRGKQVSAIRQPDLECVADGSTGAREESADRDFSAGRDVLSRPTGPQQRVRGAHLEPPRHNFAAGFLHVDMEPGVRIRPLQLRDRSGHLDRLGLIELRREGVMGDDRSDCAQKYRHQSDEKTCLTHAFLLASW